MPKRPRIKKTNDELIREWVEWLRGRRGKPSLDDVIASGNQLLLAGMLLKGFRKAARQGVFDRFKLKADTHGSAGREPSTGSVFVMIECIANAWALTGEEQRRLLGLRAAAALDALRDRPLQDVPPETLERGAILVDIFIALNAIMPPQAADRWIRAPNKAPLFGGETALTIMLRGLPDLRKVRLHLWSEAAGN